MNRSNLNPLSQGYFDYNGVVHHGYALSAQTVKKEKACEVCRMLFVSNVNALHLSVSDKATMTTYLPIQRSFCNSPLARHNAPQLR